jgi:hypothetical protein
MDGMLDALWRVIALTDIAKPCMTVSYWMLLRRDLISKTIGKGVGLGVHFYIAN